MRNVTISKVMNGFIVRVGCQTLVFDTREGLLRELRLYLENPTKIEQEYTAAYGQGLDDSIGLESANLHEACGIQGQYSDGCVTNAPSSENQVRYTPDAIVGRTRTR